MRWLFMISLCAALASGSTAFAAEGQVLKVLPQFLDKQGRQAQTPSLYDRDAYQVYLLRNPAKRSALRFAVQWKANTPPAETLTLRVEMRGIPQLDLPQQKNLEVTVQQHHWFSHWAYLKISEEEYKKLGEVTAWRVTLWDGSQLLAEQKSFLW
jgi:hypothetical protein